LEEIIRLFKNFVDFLGFNNKDIASIIFSILLATALAFIISQLYKYTHRGLNYELSFMSTLVMLSPIISVVMLFIRGDLVLSLGLIGSISIIRFRTPIKDTRDMVFLFWVIAIGLGCGTYNWDIVIISSIIISIILFILHIIDYGHSNDIDYVLVLYGNETIHTDEITQLIHKNTKETRLRSHEKDKHTWEIIYEIRTQSNDEINTEDLLSSLQAIEGVEKVSLLAPQIALPV
jgi:hypothetical protein